ncbi:hypothetical protein [Bradyrhizobium sp. URHC0002]
MTDQSVIVNLKPKTTFHMGVTGVGELSIAQPALRILRFPWGSSYPAYVGRPVHFGLSTSLRAKRSNRVADHSEFVPQRGGKPDCVIASLATATGIGYEQVADALGIELKNGIPDFTGGINDFSVLGPLFKIGWSSCPLIPAELDDQVDGTSAKQLSRDDIRELVKGHPAIIGYHDADASFHTVAWNGKEAVDCTDGLIIDLSNLPFQHAIVLTKV